MNNRKVYKIAVIIFLSAFMSSCDHGNGYRVESGRVIYEVPWNAGHGTVIRDLKADVKSFEILGKGKMLWAKDKSNIFLRGRKLDYLHAEEFVLLTDLFGKDNKTVLCDYQPIKEADVDTFEVREFIDESDKKIILGIDKNAIYECSESGYVRLTPDPIEDFSPIKDGFYSDGTKVWWHSIVLENADPDKFRVIGGGYAMDDDLIYYRGREVNGADATTFEVISDHYAKDKNYKYEYGYRIE